MKLIKLLISIIIPLILFSGCTTYLSEYVSINDQQSSLMLPPDDDQVIVYFMRPHFSHPQHQAPIFDTTPDESKFVGILQAKTKKVYRTHPGLHIFMVVYGELLPFPPMMKTGNLSYANLWVVDLHPGETYYAQIKAVISKKSIDFVPINKDELEQYDLESFKTIENTAFAYQWIQDNMEKIDKLREENYSLLPEKILLNFENKE